MSQTNKFPTFSVGITSLNNKVGVPTSIQDMDRYMLYIEKNLTSEEMFELHAMAEYLFAHEKRKYGNNSKFVGIFATVSISTRRHLRDEGVLYKIMEKRNIKNSFDILKLGKSLVLAEYRSD